VVVERARENPDEEEQEGLRAADPGDLRGGVGRQEGEGVVGLVDAKGAYDSPGWCAC
jgi:hypothetical protein